MKRKQVRPINRSEGRVPFEDLKNEDIRHEERAYQRSRDINSGFYAGVDPRRRQEYADAGMIREDQNAMANLPTQARHMEYVRYGFYSTPFICDSIMEGE